MRIGFEKPVAVYSIRGVRLRWPQSHVGPTRTFVRRAKTHASAKGIGTRHRPVSDRPSVDTVPVLSVSDVNTRP